MTTNQCCKSPVWQHTIMFSRRKRQSYRETGTLRKGRFLNSDIIKAALQPGRYYICPCFSRPPSHRELGITGIASADVISIVGRSFSGGILYLVVETACRGTGNLVIPQEGTISDQWYSNNPNDTDWSWYTYCICPCFSTPSAPRELGDLRYCASFHNGG